MRAVVLSTSIAFGLLLGSPMVASAAPADGSSIARLGQQLDPVINVKAKKTKTTASVAPCPADQERSNRTGNCRPARSQGR